MNSMLCIVLGPGPPGSQPPSHAHRNLTSLAPQERLPELPIIPREQTQRLNSDLLCLLHWQVDSLPLGPTWEAHVKDDVGRGGHRRGPGPHSVPVAEGSSSGQVPPYLPSMQVQWTCVAMQYQHGQVLLHPKDSLKAPFLV